MGLYKDIVDKKEKIAVVGLGYVGMPIAVAFAKKVNVIGFDLNKKKIDLYKSGIDPTNEVGNDEIKKTTVEFTSDETKLREAKFHIVAVPTPINSDKTPDLSPVEGASRIVGRNLTVGSIVVYESTVYPGVTEDICVPILEEESGLKCGVDFKIGYSPERINPGDKVHRLENIIKIVSGMDEESLDEIAKVYELVIEVGVHRAGSIKVAEAAKVVENSQRDINIAFMNELAMVFDRMGKFVADAIIKKLILANKVVRQANVVILGVTFKENTPDTRNSKVVDIIDSLRDYGIEPIVVDPEADADEAKHEYGIELTDIKEVHDADCLVLAVAHDIFKQMSWEDIDNLYGDFEGHEKILIDVKSILDRNEIEEKGYSYWRL